MKIALLGSAPSSVGRAPFKDSAYAAWVQGKVESMARAHGHVPGDFEIWGCSPAAWAQIPRATRWFEVHRWEPGQLWFSPEYCQFMRDFPGPVYTGAAIPEIPRHVVYPIDEMEEKFSSYFMTSSLALMLALAIDTIEKVRAARSAGNQALLPAGVDPKELTISDQEDIIGMWGVDMAATEEWGYQRPGCQFFLLEAMRRGIAVFLPPESDVMRPMPVYGLSEWDHNYIKLTARARELSQKGAIARQQLDEAQASIRHAEGGMGELNAFVQTWTSPYGMQHGLVIRQEPGTGLGSGITHFDGRPVSRMHLAPPVMQAMTESPEVHAARGLSAAIADYGREIGQSHVNAEALLARMREESGLARHHSLVLQPHMKPGESTLEAMARLFIPPVKKTRKRR